jgi:hypothetical protein
MDPINIWHLGFIAGILLNMGAASNAIILYFNSTEYRKAFKRVFAKGLVMMGNSSTVHVIHVHNSNQLNPSGFSRTNINMNPSGFSRTNQMHRNQTK